MHPRGRAAWLLLFCSVTAGPAWAQGAPADSAAASAYEHETAPSVRAGRATGAIRIDGLLDEPAWSSAEPATSFTQRDPEEGKPASERTEVRVLVGADAVYVGARLYDHEAAKIKSRLARRDDSVESDQFQVSIDSYHDHLTARLFRVCPSGAIRDAVIGSDGNEDDSWDPVWDARAVVDNEGWTAEIRIPLSQLRYNRQADAVWGIQFQRTIFRKGEAGARGAGGALRALRRRLQARHGLRLPRRAEARRIGSGRRGCSAARASVAPVSRTVGAEPPCRTRSRTALRHSRARAGARGSCRALRCR